MKFDNQIRYALAIVEDYKGNIPLAAWLKDYYRYNKQMGSKDRKTVSSLVYNFYRLGHGLQEVTRKEKMLAALFLCSVIPIELLDYFKPEWNNQITLPLEKKIEILNQSVSPSFSFSTDHIFPWKTSLSVSVEADKFNKSFFVQPNVFLRIRPGYRELIINKLRVSNTGWKEFSETCLAFPNATRLDEIIELDKEAVIQDYNSQQTANFFIPFLSSAPRDITVWDSCAASGGKSIMIYDIQPDIRLTVSDIRDSIIVNLHQRFARAGIKSYTSFVADLAEKPEDATPNRKSDIPDKKYDLVIADIPCSGSGTWSRTPEQLYFFKEEKLEYYSNLQKDILSKLIDHVKPGGKFIYITCSVFRSENEDMAEYIRKSSTLRLEKMEVLKGYDNKADSMFVASFTL